MASERTFGAVLRNRDFLKLYVGQLGSGVGDRLHQMALFGVVLQVHGIANVTETARLVFFGMLPVLLFSVLAVAWTDRWSRKLTMVAADLLRAGFAFAIPLIRHFDPSVRALYGVVFVMGTLATFHGPARLAAMPRIAEPRLLMAANSLSNSSGAVAGLLTIPVAGWAVQAFGPNPCFVIDGFTFLFSGVLIALISRSLRPQQDVERGSADNATLNAQRSTLNDMKAGLSYTVSHREALPLVLSGGLFALVSGLLLVEVLAFATAQLRLAELGVGLLISAGGLGMAAGLVLVSQTQRLRNQAALPYLALVAMGGCIAAVTLSLSPWLVALALIGVGATAGMASVPADTRLQEIVPDARRGGVFSVKQLLAAMAFLFALWLQFGTGLLRELPPPGVLAGLGALCAAGGAVLYLLHRAAARHPSA
ncbi:MAG: MFS transporter [Verrucomicrobia bacterium]|nr:MFS transporter [Verrucomicrobiota bacterium]